MEQLKESKEIEQLQLSRGGGNNLDFTPLDDFRGNERSILMFRT